MNYLKLFGSSKSRSGGIVLALLTTLLSGFIVCSASYDLETPEGMWQSLFERYRWVLVGLGGNDFEIEHTKTTMRHGRASTQIGPGHPRPVQERG